MRCGDLFEQVDEGEWSGGRACFEGLDEWEEAGVEAAGVDGFVSGQVGLEFDESFADLTLRADGVGAL